MTTIEKIDAIPKVVYVAKEQIGWDDIRYNDYGLAKFKLDLSVDEEGVRLSYYQVCNDLYYELWDVSAYTYDNDGEYLLYGTVGNCLEHCLDETIKHFHEHRTEYSDIETYSGYSYDK